MIQYFICKMRGTSGHKIQVFVYYSDFYPIFHTIIDLKTYFELKFLGFCV